MSTFYGLHNETYENYEDLINHYRPICDELKMIYDHLSSLPKEDDEWCNEIKLSLKNVLDYIGGNTENEDLIPD